MRFIEKPKHKVLINITSLIDVCFLLLIFFMISSTFLEQPGMKLELPEAKSFEVQEQRELLLHIAPDGEIYLGETMVPLDSLLLHLKEETAQSKDRALVMRADRQVSHGLVVEVMDIAKQAGIKKLVIATKIKE